MSEAEIWGRALTLFAEVATVPEMDQVRLVSEVCRTEPQVGAMLRRLLATEAEPDTTTSADVERIAVELFVEEAEASDRFLGRTIGPYRVVSMLGAGGMGRVYLAMHQDYQGPVALKILPESVTEDRRARFKLEKEHLAKFRHPSIAQLYYADTTEDGTAYFAMEYVEGEPITSFCTRKRLTLRERLRPFLQVCDAVQAAHAQRIVHRDLKPSNIFVREDGSVKLLDFGIAEQSKSGISDTADRPREPAGRLMSLPYAAPEHGGAEAGVGVDVFSLGILLHEMLTGRLPFQTQGRTAEQIRRAVREGEWTRPSIMAKEQAELGNTSATGWRELDHVVRRATAHEVSERYPSVEAMARELRQHVAKEPLDTLDGGWTYQTNRFASRHAGGLLVAAAVLLAITGLISTYTYRLSRARDAALAEAAHSARVEKFLEEMFNGGNGDAGPSEDMRVRDLLETGIQKANALTNDPRLQAELFQTLGDVYTDLDAFEKADDLLRRAVDEKSQAFGKDSPQVANTLVDIAKLREEERRTPESLQLIEQAVGIDSRKLPANDSQRLHAEIALGEILNHSGDSQRAALILQSALKLERERKDSLPDLSDALTDLGIAELSLGHLEKAETADQEAMQIDRQLLGDRHPDIASHLLNQADIAERRGQYSRTEADAREALSIFRAWLGPNHSEVASASNYLADALWQQGRSAEAMPLLEDALRIEQQVYKLPSSALAHTLGSMGTSWMTMGDRSKAERYYQQSVDVYRVIYPHGHMSTGMMLFNLAKLQSTEGKNAQAERNLQEALALESHDLPANDRRVVDVGRLLAKVQKQAGGR